MALRQAPLGHVRVSPPPAVLHQPSVGASLAGADAIRPAAVATRRSPLFLSLAIWFVCGFVLGAVSALLMMPDLFAALASLPLQHPSSYLISSQFSDATLNPSVLGEPFFVLGLILAIIPLLTAIGIIAGPRMPVTGQTTKVKSPDAEKIRQYGEEPRPGPEDALEEERTQTQYDRDHIPEQEKKAAPPVEEVVTGKEKEEEMTEKDEPAEEEKALWQELATLFEENDGPAAAKEPPSQGSPNNDAEQLVDIMSDLS
jgi:hypothetical protein